MVNKKYHGKISTYEQQVEQHIADSATLRRWVKTRRVYKEAGEGNRDRVARQYMGLARIYTGGNIWRVSITLLRNVSEQVKTHVSNVAEVVFTCGKFQIIENLASKIVLYNSWRKI